MMGLENGVWGGGRGRGVNDGIGWEEKIEVGDEVGCKGLGEK